MSQRPLADYNNNKNNKRTLNEEKLYNKNLCIKKMTCTLNEWPKKKLKEKTKLNNTHGK